MPKEKASKSVHCDIRFDNNPNGIFKAGDKVSGSVTLTLTQLKKVRGVCFLVTGFADTFWIDKVPHGPKNKKTKAHFKGHEDFILQKSYFVGSDTGNPIDLSTGAQYHYFHFDIPAKAPTSMEGKHGHVRYAVKVTLERPWKYDQNFQLPFTVLAKVELDDTNLALKNPFKVQDQLRFYCWCCRSNPLMVTATVSRTGFIPGDTIPLVIAVNNLSKEEVSEIVVKFQKVVKFLSQVQLIEQTQILVENQLVKYETVEVQKTLPVAKLTSETFEQKFLVGPITPTEDRISKVIKIGYELNILVKPKLSTQRIEMVIPIFIGSAGMKTEEAISFVRSTGIDKLTADLNRDQPTAPPPPYIENRESLYPISSLQRAYEGDEIDGK
ncbi:arrestin domain-containing protein 3-like [Topomyia yanbarensis]|uniref:arrestin domain-containing protein 3-like n=1 Tax=Topomyia yanbarensis TaxID=2498891 RepID=UPI00273CDF36|nr:arrestin domain-containing protein 3-like [Topomyia yanbarensis]